MHRMKTFPRLLILLLNAALLAGCATADFHQYTGAQQNWPTASGTFVSTKYDVPAYFGAPDRPYIVLGSLDVTTGPPGGNLATRQEDGIEYATGKAKKMGGDAIVVLNYGKVQAGSGSFANASTNSSQTGGFIGTVSGPNVYGHTYGNTVSTTNMFGSSFGTFQGKASVLVIKFK
jgi:hypothetical protein